MLELSPENLHLLGEVLNDGVLLPVLLVQSVHLVPAPHHLSLQVFHCNKLTINAPFRILELTQLSDLPGLNS